MPNWHFKTTLTAYCYITLFFSLCLLLLLIFPFPFDISGYTLLIVLRKFLHLPLLHLDTHTNPECGVGINIQLSLQGFYNEIQKDAEEKMNTITLQDIIDAYYQRTSIENNLQNII